MISVLNLIDIRQTNLTITEYQLDWWIKDQKWIVVGHPLSPFLNTITFIDSKLTLNARTAFRQEVC